MIVTEDDLVSERLALLPADWRIHGTARQALSVQRRRWKNHMANCRIMRTLPSGMGLAIGADTDRGVTIELIPIEWKWLRGQRGLRFALAPGWPARYQTQDVARDFDVVRLDSNEVLVSVRQAERVQTPAQEVR